MAATVHNFPTFGDSNPQGTWSVMYGSGPNWTTGNQLSLMVDKGTVWASPNASVPYIKKGTDPLWQHSGHSGWNDAGVLVFQAAQTGNYSIDVRWASYGAMGDPTTEYLKVRTAPDASTATTTLWSATHSWTSGSGVIHVDDLSAVAALQDVYLTAGSYLFFDMSVKTEAYYPGVYNRFLATSTSGTAGAITYEVPEPATLGLVVMGGLAMLRRRLAR